MKLVRADQPIHAGGVTYDTYILRHSSDDVHYSKTRVSAEGTEFYLEHHPSFLIYWKQVSHYHFKILKDTDGNRGFILQLWVERPFNTAGAIVELD